MAKKNKERIILEDIELKPQVIGYTYQKKSNIGRVIFIFIIFLLVVYYINDISIFINNLLNKKTAESIKEQSGNKENNNNNNNNNSNNEDDEVNEVIFNIFSNTLEIKEDNFTLKNFNFIDNVLTFDIYNNSNSSINLSDKKYFIEIFNSEKTLLERHKLDIEVIASGKNINYQYELNNSIYYIVLVEKTTQDYPNVTLQEDENKVSKLTCIKDIETITYTFKNKELTDINHIVTEESISEDYSNNYIYYQTKATNYNNIEGITASFNTTQMGYSAIFAIDTEKVNLSEVDEKYYYAYKEEVKVVKFEMETYGFTCN